MRYFRTAKVKSWPMAVFLFAHVDPAIADALTCQFDSACTATGTCQDAAISINLVGQGETAMIAVEGSDPRSAAKLKEKRSSSWLIQGPDYWEILQVDLAGKAALIAGGGSVDGLFTYFGLCEGVE